MNNIFVSLFRRAPFNKGRTLFYVWMTSGLVYAIVKLLMGKYNNYKIFEYVFPHVVNGQHLYIEYPAEYYDLNHYGPLFAFVIAPFSLMPEWLGMIAWVLANTLFLFYAIKQLPLSSQRKIIIGWFSLCELMTAQGVQQFNISVAAFIILSFVMIEKEKDFWAAFFILLGTLIKIYPIVGLAFFFFSKHKRKLILSCIFWFVLLLGLPSLIAPGGDYILSQYTEWFERLPIKNQLNMFAESQNISLLGIVRKISGNGHYSDLWLILPGILLFSIPYSRRSQYKYLCFRLSLLANVLLFVVLFSTGSEASGYISAMIGTAIWYVCSPSPNRNYNFFLLITTLIVVGLSTTELVPPPIRKGFITPFVLKAWPCVVIWITICLEMMHLDYSKANKIKSSNFQKLISSNRQ